ncbi:MAG: F0F1 ATP synthase subunit epsilon [Caldilineaceae bacterium]
MTIHVEIVAPDKTLYSGDVQMVTLPGADGQMGVLGGHAPLLTTLGIGEIVLHGAGEPEYLAVSGGVAEVRPNKVTILADVAETADEIDEERAQAALARAQQSLAENPPAEHRAPLLESMRRSNLRLRVARKRRRSARPQFQVSDE